MTKEAFEAYIAGLMADIHKAWLSYIDSVPEEGNEEGKKTAYLDMTFFRGSMSVNSTTEDKKLRGEYQIDLFKSIDVDVWFKVTEVKNGKEN